MMLKKILSICLLLIIFTSSFASSKMLHYFHSNRNQINTSQVLQSSDFTGEWIGTCFAPTGEEEINTKLEDNDSFIKLNGLMFQYNEVTTVSFNTSTLIGEDHIHFRKNKDINEIIATIISYEHTKSHEDEKQHGLDGYVEKIRFSKENDHLILNVSGFLFEDGVRTEDKNFRCDLSKK